MKTSPSTKTIAWIVAALMLCFMVASFFPYYSYGEGETASLMGYLAMPGDYPALEANLNEQLGSFQANDIVGAVLLPVIAAIVLFILILKFRDNTILMGASAVWGIWGTINFMTNAALKVGGGLRTVLIAMMLAVTLLSAVAVVIKVVETRRAQENTQDTSGQGQAIAH